MTQITAQTDFVDDKKITSTAAVPVSSGQKESEPAKAESNFEQEAKLLSEIKEVSNDADRKAEAAVSEELVKIGEKAKTTEADIPADVKKAGVHDIAGEASEVISGGSTINLGATEDEYVTGLKTKTGGISVNKTILNVSSVVALAIWIGRQIKRAHVKTMKVVFKRGENR